MVWKPKLSAAVLAMAMLLPTISVAQNVTVQQLLFTINSQDTPFTQTISIPQYDPSTFGGRQLEEIVFLLEGEAISNISVNAIEDVSILNGGVGALITAQNNALGLSLTAIPGGSFAPPTLNLAAGTTTVFPTIQGSDQDSTTLTGLALAPFIGTGSFTTTLSATGTNTIQTAGGNFDLFQRTEAEATFLVEFRAAAVPEPGSGLLILSTLTAMVIRRRRKC